MRIHETFLQMHVFEEACRYHPTCSQRAGHRVSTSKLCVFCKEFVEEVRPGGSSSSEQKGDEEVSPAGFPGFWAGRGKGRSGCRVLTNE